MLRREIDRIGIEEYKRTFTTIFCNTGKEHDATLDFVHEVETRWGVPIVWLEYTRIPAMEIDSELVPEGRKRKNLIKAQSSNEGAHWFKIVDFDSAARADNPRPFNELLQWMPALPNVRGRACSAFLKIRNIAKYCHALKMPEWNDYIGIRKDEEHRKHEILANADDKSRTPIFPLCDEFQTKEDVNGWWEAHPFRLNIPNHMGNCDLCFLKARWKRVAAAKANPKSAQWWAEWEARKEAEGVTGDGARFIKSKGNSYAAIINDAEHPDLFEDKTEEDIPCSCAVGGYRAKDEESDSLFA